MVPPLWDSRWRGVTGLPSVSGLGGSFQRLRTVLMSASRLSLPSWTRVMAAMAATGLLIEAAWKRV